MQSNIPAIDPDAIRTYCNVLFGYLDGYVPIRYISEKGTPDKPIQKRFVLPQDLAEHLIKSSERSAATGMAVYVVPCTVPKPGQAKESDITATGVLVIDIDTGDTDAKKDHLIRYLGTPTLIVASGGVTDEGHVKYHLYWRLSEAAEGDDLKLVRRLREIMAIKAGGDDSFKNMTQPIRVAGTCHGKYGRLSPVRLLSFSGVEYHLPDIAAAVDAMPALNDAIADWKDFNSANLQGPKAQDLMTKVIREGAQDQATRFEALSKIMGHWIRMVRHGRVTMDDAWRAVQEQNAATIRPPWQEERLAQEFNALLRVDTEKNGPIHGREDPVNRPITAPEFSEDALAQEFVRDFGRDWRYVGVWGQWLWWTGQVWKPDTVGRAFEMVRIACRNAALRTNRPSDQRRLASARTMQAVLRIASNDPRISTDIDCLDQHVFLLNTPGGVIDLETGTVSPHEPQLLITQMTRANLGSNCPTWAKFLETVTGGDSDLIRYLARVAGYCLTGSTKEQAFFLLHGLGANGKSVFLQTLAYVLGDYAATAAADTFINRSGTRHLSELAGLRGARLVLMSETEADAHWAEARIKMVTGGERLRANFMYKDHFEFVPQFKLMVGTNHRPALGEVGEAMRRRLHLIPFNVTIPADERDPDLAGKLKAEADGILGWMVAGWRDLQELGGLHAPTCVTAAVAEYLATEDRFGQWIEECCQIGAASRAASKSLFASWSGWARDAGLDPKTNRYLGEQLRSRGFTDGKVGRDRGWFGIGIRSVRPEGADG